MEYKVGDRVRILTQKELPDDVLFGWNSRMNQYENQIYEIEHVEIFGSRLRYYFKDPSHAVNNWAWSSDMLTLAYDEPKEDEVFALFV